MLKVKKDLTGEIFGRWKVICQAEDHVSSSGKHEIAWLCECTCEKHTRKIVKSWFWYINFCYDICDF